MNSILILVSIFALSTPVFSKTEVETKHFGGEMTQKENVRLSEIVADFSKFKGKLVAFEATPKKVCKKSGCWMVLESGETQVRTLFKDYGFFVPQSILGKKVKVQGVMEKKEVSAATRRHYLKDAGASVKEVKKIVSGESQFQFTAEAVEII